MKKLLASCAVVALMAAPAIAQSTFDPTTPDTVPVDPQVEQAPDDVDVLQPQTDRLPEGLPPEPDMAEETAPPTPDAAPVREAEVTEEEDTFAESGPVVTAQMAPEEEALKASVDEADLPEEYATDDLNARMLAQVNTAADEISALDSEADVWVSVDGSPVDPAYAPEGQGDMEATPDEDSNTAPNSDYITTPEPDADNYVTPESDTTVDDSWMQDEPVMPEDETPMENSLNNDNPASTEY